MRLTAKEDEKKERKEREISLTVHNRGQCLNMNRTERQFVYKERFNSFNSLNS